MVGIQKLSRLLADSKCGMIKLVARNVREAEGPLGFEIAGHR